jgi:hypothetical protein
MIMQETVGAIRPLDLAAMAEARQRRARPATVSAK